MNQLGTGFEEVHLEAMCILTDVYKEQVIKICSKNIYFSHFLYFHNLPVILLPLHPKNLQRCKMLFMACVPLDAKINGSEHVYL